jgi:hypothetical protein
MTSAPIRDPLWDHLLTPQNAAFLFIDYSRPSWPASARWTRRSWLRIFAGAVTSYVAAHLAAARIIGRPALTGLALAHGYDTAFWPAVPRPGASAHRPSQDRSGGA